MKILWFTNNAVNLESGITRGRWMQRLAEELSKDSNIQLHIATRSGGRDLRRITDLGITYYLIPDKRNLLQKRLDVFLNREPTDEMVGRYNHIIKEIKPDIVHVFGTEMDYGLVSGLTDIPVMIHIQGILLPIYYHLSKIHVPFWKALRAATAIDRIKGSTIRNGLQIFKRRAETEGRIFQFCRYFIGRTDWDRQMVRLFAPQASYFHCDEMLREIFFKTVWKGNESRTINLVSIISGPLYKGHETLVETGLALQRAGSSFVWHIIGLAANSPTYRIFYRDGMKQLVDHFRLHGELKPEDMTPILENAHLYVHPSHIENSSNAICEAMAMGMPVVALYTGGNASLIENGVDGILVPDNDPFFLAATIKDVCSNSTLLRQMGNQAKDKASVRHDPARITAELRNIYETVISLHEKMR